MSCRRCKSTTCPGCVTEVDCVGCEQPVSIDHTDSKGRCPVCAAGVAAALEGEREAAVSTVETLPPPDRRTSDVRCVVQGCGDHADTFVAAPRIHNVTRQVIRPGAPLCATCYPQTSPIVRAA